MGSPSAAWDSHSRARLLLLVSPSRSPPDSKCGDAESVLHEEMFRERAKLLLKTQSSDETSGTFVPRPWSVAVRIRDIYLNN